MDTALAVVQHTAAIQPAPFFTADQESMILRNFLGGASRDEATVLLEIVKRRRLDPFSRQVYFVKRWDSQKRCETWAIQTSIDGLRTIAERSGKYDGQDEPVYGEDEGGKFCKVKVYRKDWSSGRGAVGVAYESEFIQKTKDGAPTKFWKEKPRLMLAKCAEALAIRKAFPEDTAGLYIPEEMPEKAPEERRSTPPAVEAPAVVQPAPLPPPPEPESAPVVAAQAADVVDVLAQAGAEVSEELSQPVTQEEVDLLWNRVLKENEGNQSEAGIDWKDAAIRVFGRRVPDPKKWTRGQMRSVERYLFPPGDVGDVPF